MTTPTPLSPAAQAVMDAFGGRTGLYEDVLSHERRGLAAALRAAVDQVVPEVDEPDWGACNELRCDIELYTDHWRKRAALLAIATELEGAR